MIQCCYMQRNLHVFFRLETSWSCRLIKKKKKVIKHLAEAMILVCSTVLPTAAALYSSGRSGPSSPMLLTQPHAEAEVFKSSYSLGIHCNETASDGREDSFRYIWPGSPHSINVWPWKKQPHPQLHESFSPTGLSLDLPYPSLTWEWSTWETWQQPLP